MDESKVRELFVMNPLSAVRALQEEITTLRARLESARRLLGNVAFTVPTFDDDRIKIVDIQLDRVDLKDILKWLAENGEE